MSNKQVSVSDVAVALNELDFNVSDEEISLAKQVWLHESNSDDLLKIKQVQHPV